MAHGIAAPARKQAPPLRHVVIATSSRHGPSATAGARRSVAGKAVTDPDAVPPAILHAIETAQRELKADPLVLLAIAWQESRLNPRARNRHSTARGLLQFTDVTWLTVVRDFGAKHGLNYYAGAIKTDQDGHLSVRTPRLRRAILALRDNPKLQVIMAAERLAQEKVALEASLGRSVSPADLYMLHLLGPSGAKDFLTQLAQNPATPSATVIGTVFEPNAGLFMHDGRPLSLAEAYEAIGDALREQAAQHAALFSTGAG